MSPTAQLIEKPLNLYRLSPTSSKMINLDEIVFVDLNAHWNDEGAEFTGVEIFMRRDPGNSFKFSGEEANLMANLLVEKSLCGNNS